MEEAPAGGLVPYVPNVLTLLRLCALPVIVYLYGLDAPGASWATAVVVLIAALSDVADGQVARHYHVQSEFGRWADPLVDRAFFFVLAGMLWWYGTLPGLAVLPLVVRDGIILTLALPALVWTEQKPRIARWSKLGNLVLVCAFEWFIVGDQRVGWMFYVVGAVLYVASGLWYGYVALAWACRDRRRDAAT